MLMKTASSIKRPPSPKTKEELVDRANTLSGKTLAELSKSYPEALPSSHKEAKGFVGKLIEWHLGADDNNLPQPDFIHLNIELKTLPLNEKGLASESTYVCTAPFNIRETWMTSRVRQKLNHILWVPFEADQNIPFRDRRIGSPLLWHLTPEMESILAEDWEELTTLLQFGQAENLNAKVGKFLQIRPKAANSRVLIKNINAEGEENYMNPKGFYLRTSFTNQILKQHYCFI